jgi:hypothetical protein
LSSSVHVRCRPFVFISVHRFVCWCRQPSQGGGEIVRALANWQGGGYLLGYFPTLHGYIPRSASLSSDLCRCRTCIMVVESMPSLSNLHHGCQIRIVVVKSAVMVVVVEFASSGFRRCDIPTCGVVELISWLSNPRCCGRICVIRFSSLNTWHCHQTRVVVVESASSGFRCSLVICGGWRVLRTSQEDQVQQ